MSRPIALTALLATLAVAWGRVLVELGRRWSEPQASHGLLVVGIGGWMAWTEFRRGPTSALTSPSSAARAGTTPVALFGLMVAVVARLAAHRFDMQALADLSILPAVAGVVLLVFGADGLRRFAPSVAMLGLALPLPWRLESSLSNSLQTLSTTIAVFLLQLVGLPVFARGNILDTEGTQVGVAEACSGLRMLTVQIVLSAAIALCVERPAWQKIALILSAPLIAVACNSIRLAATVLAHRYSRAETAASLHDLFGWLMAPLGLAAVVAELRLMHWAARPTPERLA